MVANTIVNQSAVQKMAQGIRLAFYLSLIINVYDIYRFIDKSGELREGISVAFGILGTMLLWQLSNKLQAEKKQALYYWFALLFVVYIRFIFVDRAMSISLIGMGLLLLAAVLTVKIVFWTRDGVLN